MRPPQLAPQGFQADRRKVQPGSTQRGDRQDDHRATARENWFWVRRGAVPHGVQAVELAYFVHFGMTPAPFKPYSSDRRSDGLQDRIGSIKRGKYAHIIAVNGDPSQGITELERVKFVMKGRPGRLLSQLSPPQFLSGSGSCSD